MSAPDAEHLSWDSFQDLILAGIPVRRRVAQQPPIDVFASQAGARIGLRVPFASADRLPPSPFSEILIRGVSQSGESLLELSTTNHELFREFYSLLQVIVDRFVKDGVPSVAAITESIEGWRSLLRPVPLMTEDRQVGLLGELWALQRLLATMGPAALDAWVGPMGEPHDFRVGNHEFEVKATRSVRRVHMINGVTQLVPSRGHDLWVLSLQFEPAGAQSGVTLPQYVERVNNLLSSTERHQHLASRLKAATGYESEHAPYYTQRYQLRTPPRLISVDGVCPAITPELLAAQGPSTAQRILELHYSVDLEGLGIPETAPEFDLILR